MVGWFAPDLVDVDTDDEKGPSYNSNNNNNINNSYNSINTNTQQTNANGGARKNKWKAMNDKTVSASNSTSNSAAASPTSGMNSYMSSKTNDSANSPTDSNLGVNEIGQYFPLSQLKGKNELPNGVNAKKLEVYLDESEFEEAFKMSKDEFYAMPLWKQRRAKKEVGLF